LQALKIHQDKKTIKRKRKGGKKRGEPKAKCGKIKNKKSGVV
jgi:hypothetical protein